MVRLFKEDSYDDVLNPKIFMIRDVWEDEVYDVVEKAKGLGIKEEDIDYDDDSQTIKIMYSPYSGMAFDRCANLYNWFIHFKDWYRKAEFNESVSLEEREYVDDKYVLNSKESMNMEDDLRGIYVDDSLDILEDELSAEGFEYYDEGQCIEPKDCGYRIWVNGTFKVTIYYGLDDNIVFNIYVKEKDNMMEGVEIEVKNKGVLEVPEGKTVDQLPMSHFEKLAKEKGLSKITKALNNLQVWNKNDDPKLSKWAGNMIDKLNKKLKKDESVSNRFVENRRRPRYGYTIADYVEIRKDAISKGYTGNEPLRDFMREYDLTDTEAIAILSQIRNGRNAKESTNEAASKHGRKRSTGKSNSVASFLDRQIESGKIDEKQITVVYDKNNNIMWLGKAGFYPLILSNVEYRSSGYDKDHPHEFWINARSYTQPFEENLSVKDVKKLTIDEESMGMLDDIAKMQKNRSSRTEYEQKEDDKKIKDYVKRINDKLNTKESLVKESILQEEDDYWWTQIPSDLVDVVKEMERLGWEGVGYTTTGVDYCISATDSNRPELDYEMCVSIQEYDDAVSLSKYVDIYDWDKEKEVSRVPNSSGVSEMYTVDDVRKFTNWLNALANGSNRGSNVRLNRESLGYDRYDPNVEADFMEPGNLYDDMPDEEPTQDDVFEFYVSYCMNNCRNENEARKYLEYENLPESFIDSIIEEVYNRFNEQL